MCNIAGYVGEKAAAPILIEMLRRQEGLAAGYYSGIATIHEGKIYYAKLTGDVQRLQDLTEAARLPGTIGIIHGRSKSGGGDKWAHPFVHETDNGVREAYVANGAAGCFAGGRQAANLLTQELLQQGYTMHSHEPVQIEGYPALSDGTGVHMSDSMCQLISRNIDRGMTPDTAIGEAYLQMPGEIVGLLLSLADPEGIAWSRINMPMMLGFCDHGAYLASSAMGIPTDSREPIALPPCASGMVYRDSFTVKPYPTLPARVAPVTARVRQQAYTKICEALSAAPQGVGELQDVICPLFAAADCVPMTLVVYDVLCSLEQEGRLKTECRRLPGAFEGLEAPKFFFSIQ